MISYFFIFVFKTSHFFRRMNYFIQVISVFKRIVIFFFSYYPSKRFSITTIALSALEFGHIFLKFSVFYIIPRYKFSHYFFTTISAFIFYPNSISFLIKKLLKYIRLIFCNFQRIFFRESRTMVYFSFYTVFTFELFVRFNFTRIEIASNVFSTYNTFISNSKFIVSMKII